MLTVTNDDYDFKECIEKNTLEKGKKRMEPFINFLFDYKEEFRLLLLHAQGAKVEDFMEQLTKEYIKHNLLFLERAYQAGVSKRQLNPMSVHFLTKGFLNSIFEIVLHDISKEEAAPYIDEIEKFQYYGWNGLIGLYDCKS